MQNMVAINIFLLKPKYNHSPASSPCSWPGSPTDPNTEEWRRKSFCMSSGVPILRLSKLALSWPFKSFNNWHGYWIQRVIIYRVTCWLIYIVRRTTITNVNPSYMCQWFIQLLHKKRNNCLRCPTCPHFEQWCHLSSLNLFGFQKCHGFKVSKSTISTR